MRSTITESEAQRLLASGEWVKEHDLKREILASTGPAPPFVASLWSDLAAVLATRTETRQVDEDFPPGIMGLRCGPYTVYKVGPTLRRAAGRAVMIAAALYAGAPALSKGAAIALFKVLIAGYERIADPDEQVVFEALFAVGDRPTQSILGLGAAVPEPTVAGVTRHLAGAVDEQRVAHALERLHQRGVVAESAGRWSIRW